jgi:hypothetical protein
MIVQQAQSWQVHKVYRVLARGLTLACFIAGTGAAASTHTGRGITPAAVGARPKATEHNLIDSSDEDEEREALLKPGTNSSRGITPART